MSSSRALPATRPANQKWMVALSVTFGTLMGAIDSSIVNVALSQIRGAVGATVQEITWISTGFSMAMVLVMPLTGFLGRMFGQKRVYLACLTLFVVGSTLCGIAWSLPSLVLFRVIQGFGAGALQPTEQAILRQTFPPEEQGMAMALFTVAIMVGPAFGPTLGGYIVDNFHWSWIFFINVPVGILGFAMVSRFVHEDEELKATMRAAAEKQRKHMDWLGIGLLWTALISLQYLLEEGQSHEWFDSPMIVVMAMIAFFGIVAFVVRELTAPAPAVNLRLFKDRTFATGTLVAASVMSVMMSGMFLLPLFMQELLGFTAMQSGMAMMPRTLVMVVAMPIMGRLYTRFPPAAVVSLGLALVALGQLTLSQLTLQSTASHIISAIVLQGVGMSMVLVPLGTLSLSRIPKAQLADAAGLSSLLRQVGGSMGLAALASLLSRYGTVGRETLKWQISPERTEVARRVAGTTSALLSRGLDAAAAQATALRGLAGEVARQGTVLGFEKTFTVGAILFAAVFPLVWLLRAPPKLAATSGKERPEAHVEIEV